ncbi:hypothetical protein PILCRDRAFT_70728 [Piloderma croceum F 1598]|uniref:peptidyl-tRNA hydrolase n=1 Tax=Piloderma croceum (strain F 1598) TaxID=765440 RepID=A0A0C3B8E4_PILCF|nr:hypothetical protein PILCRDRAFT_70728 [Piloderma croceum F 1598]
MEHEANNDHDTDAPQLEESRRDPLVMQIVVRRDLLNEDGWGYGPLMSQTAHAAVAVLHETRDRKETIEYLADLKDMHKVRFLWLVPSDSDTSSDKASNNASSEAPIPHYLWIEQPENTPTCIALAPNRRQKAIRRALDKCSCRLWKG